MLYFFLLCYDLFLTLMQETAILFATILCTRECEMSFDSLVEISRVCLMYLLKYQKLKYQIILRENLKFIDIF